MNRACLAGLVGHGFGCPCGEARLRVVGQNSCPASPARLHERLIEVNNGMTDWRLELIKAMGGRCQYINSDTGEQCTVTDLSRLDLHHLTDVPLGNARDRRIEINEWRRTGKIPDNEEVRCDDHHKIENVKGNPIRQAQWKLKQRVEREAREERLRDPSP